MELPAGHTKWLGATPDADGRGTNFAFYTSKDATRVELCLFDKAQGANETHHFDLKAKEDVLGDNGQLLGYIWHGHAEGVREGRLYGFRVHGEYNPERRKFFNPNKLLVDPCAKAVTHEIHEWEKRHFPGNFEDNGPIMPKARVVDWQKLHREATDGVPVGALRPHPDTNLLELHVKGATILHPKIVKEERGTYKALSHRAFINWVKKMGFKGIELMPVESFGTDGGLADRGKINHWGYMTMAPTALYTGYAATQKPEVEFANTVRNLKKAGIEVMLDVVPNHTLECGDGGPALNLRIEDGEMYIREDMTGCGNTRDFGHPMNRRMFLEELKYWKGMGVSGFRIDLATVIGREHGNGFDPNSHMIKAIREDPELKDIKFYGEPWDLGSGASMREQVGKLSHTTPPKDGEVGIPDENHIAEWNPHYRDKMREAALSHEGELSRSSIIWTMSGSPGPYTDPMKQVNKPGGGHDGATLFDAISRPNGKDNRLNGEDNRDGNEIEPRHYWANPDDQLRVQRFALALLSVSQGTPMITIGHERCHTQGGNTNLYCLNKNPEDPTNHGAWIKWPNKMDADAKNMMSFTRACNFFRNNHSSLRRATFFTGKPDEASGLTFKGTSMKDVTWLDPAAGELAGDAMNKPGGFGMLLSGDPGNSSPDEQCFTRRVQRKERDIPLLVLVNPTMADVTYTLPEVPGVSWKPVLKSNPKDTHKDAIGGNDTITLGFHSLIAFEGSRLRAVGKYTGQLAATRNLAIGA